MARHDHDHGAPPSDTALRVKALESLLIEKGLVDPAALDALIDTYENKVGPRNGAAVVARAWSDPAYKARLMDDATAAIAELGFTGRQLDRMSVVYMSRLKSRWFCHVVDPFCLVAHLRCFTF